MRVFGSATRDLWSHKLVKIQEGKVKIVLGRDIEMEKIIHLLMVGLIQKFMHRPMNKFDLGEWVEK